MTTSTLSTPPAPPRPQPCVTCGQPVSDSEIGWTHISAPGGQSVGWQCPPPHMRLATPDPQADSVAGQEPSSPAPAPPSTPDEPAAQPAGEQRPSPRTVAQIPQYRRDAPAWGHVEREPTPSPQAGGTQ